MSQVHSFSVDMERAKKDGVFWEKFYRNVYEFRDMVKPTEFSEDIEDQRNGIDRRIFLPYGVATVEEKLRWKNPKFNGCKPVDILLEHVSVKQTNSPGWIEKDLKCDWFAYAWEDARMGYIMPWKQLRQAWVQNREKWLSRFQITSSTNSSYDTLCVAVPIEELQRNIQHMQYVSAITFEEANDEFLR